MKKFTSTIAALAVSISSLTIAASSAINVPTLNDYSFSTNTVDEARIVNGVLVPAGSIAITVDIANNTGFSSSSTSIRLGSAYSAILNNDQMLVIEKGDAIGDSSVMGAANGNNVFVASASATDNNNDGDMFTFFATIDDQSDDLSISLISDMPAVQAAANSPASPFSTTSGYYQVGDVDNDGVIDADDSSAILRAIHINNDNQISIAAANANLSYYFPYSPNIVCAQSANPLCPVFDENGDQILNYNEIKNGLSRGYINTHDADDVLRYYALCMSGNQNNYSNQSDGFCGWHMYAD